MDFLKQKQINKKNNLKFLNEHNIEYTVLNNGSQLNLTFGDKQVVAFYPTTNKWVWRGETFGGGAKELWDWIGMMEEFCVRNDVLLKSK